MNRIVCVAVTACMLAVCSMTAWAQAPKVAVANPAKIFNDLQELKDVRSKMEAERKVLEGVDREKKEALSALEASRDALKANSPQWQERNSELLKAAIEYEVWGRTTQANFQRDQKMQLKSVYERIEQTIGQIAKQKGYDLVIADQRSELPDNLDRLNIDQLRSIINSRTVLYSTSAVDISADVLAAMDAEYRATPAAPAAAPAAPATPAPAAPAVKP